MPIYLLVEPTYLKIKYILNELDLRSKIKFIFESSEDSSPTFS